MLVSLSELKANPGKYVDMADQQCIYITRNGKKVARLTTARPDKLACARLFKKMFLIRRHARHYIIYFSLLWL